MVRVVRTAGEAEGFVPHAFIHVGRFGAGVAVADEVKEEVAQLVVTVRGFDEGRTVNRDELVDRRLV